MPLGAFDLAYYSVLATALLLAGFFLFRPAENTAHYIWRMLLVLLAIVVTAFPWFDTLKAIFDSNQAFNGVILGALLVGIVFIVFQTRRLIPEYHWVREMQRYMLADKPRRSLHASKPPAYKPRLLVNLAGIMLRHAPQASGITQGNMPTILDGIAIRLDETREISRYMVGLLVFLGLLGTFWGLLETIRAVGAVVSGIDLSNADFSAMMEQFRSGLGAPLAGMATAFSSSLFGLGGSLVLGFLDLQLGQASGRLLTTVEDWLTAMVRFGQYQGDPQLMASLVEEVADRVRAISHNIESGDDRNRQLLTELSELNKNLRALTSQDARHLQAIGEAVERLEATLQQHKQEMQGDRNALVEAVTSEVRALASTLTKMTSDKA